MQHEYGIWGGEDGAYVIDFVRSLRVPAVATLHTVLRDPISGPARRPVGTGRSHRGHGRHVAICGGPADERLRRRCSAPAHHPARSARPPARRSRDDQSRPGTGGTRRDPELRPAGPRQGFDLALDALPEVVATTPRPAMSSSGPPTPISSDRRRSLSRPAGRPDPAPGDGRSRPIRRIASWAGWS